MRVEQLAQVIRRFLIRSSEIKRVISSVRLVYEHDWLLESDRIADLQLAFGHEEKSERK